MTYHAMPPSYTAASVEVFMDTLVTKLAAAANDLRRAAHDGTASDGDAAERIATQFEQTASHQTRIRTAHE